MKSENIKIETIHRTECAHATGLVVVIDVIRAFTTAAVAFGRNAEKIILVGTVEEAFDLQRENPHYLLMGEVDGYPIDGFHFGNSPAEIARHDLTGKTLVQRTSSGTQGVVACINADRILTSSFVVAKATLDRILKIKPSKVTFVITGHKMGGNEDYALADYLGDCLLKSEVDPKEYLNRVMESPSALRALENPLDARCFKEDLDYVIDLDKYSFAMEILKEESHLVLKAVN